MSPTPRPIPLPSLSQHLREFAARRDAWLVLARNLVPVVGIYLLGWSVALAAFNYWFDGLAALAAILAALTPRAVRETQPAAQGFAGRLRLFGTGMFTWAFLVGIVGLPYWIVLIPLHELLLGAELRAQLAHSPACGRPLARWRPASSGRPSRSATTPCPNPSSSSARAGTCTC